jgi:hypothetical protein
MRADEPGGIAGSADNLATVPRLHIGCLVDLDSPGLILPELEAFAACQLGNLIALFDPTYGEGEGFELHLLERCDFSLCTK